MSDRDSAGWCRQLPPSQPSPSSPLPAQELVEDKLLNGVLRPRYLAYDIMQLSGRADIARCSHDVRLQCIHREVISPRDVAVSARPSTQSVTRSSLYYSSDTEGLSRQDGRTFQHSSEAVLGCQGYSLGTAMMTSGVIFLLM